ncbi:MAG: GNAT family N-acetyltransferase [Acidobacteriota bacterium]|nr:GNAT family N-acetyltransferase [Acidobacteriota bacterium]
MDSTYSVSLEAEPKASDMNAIVQGLFLFNSQQTGGATLQYLVATVRDDNNAVVGGLVGATYLGWLQVHAVWLPEELRGRGYGGRLLALAEEEALRRGCPNACLETLSFQALPFYEKNGYVVFAKLADLPPGGAKYFLSKRLVAEN